MVAPRVTVTLTERQLEALIMAAEVISDGAAEWLGDLDAEVLRQAGAALAEAQR